MSYTLTQAKDLVINQGYAICNDDSVNKLREVIKLVFSKDEDIPYGDETYYFNDNESWAGDCMFDGNSINLSKIELPKKITIEMVIELTKKHTNDMDLGSELRKLLNN